MYDIPRRLRQLWLAATVPLALLNAGQAFAGTDDPTLSPYFVVTASAGSDGSAEETLPLEATSVEAHIAGVTAHVRVEQVYRNRGTQPLEAIYVFPGSTRAAVFAMRMTIGERVITAQIDQRARARERYAEARDAGQTASLLEQQRPNVFQMNVANILPGEQIRVELHYNETLLPDAGVYEFVYPAVVGPRYTEQNAGEAPQREAWIKNPFQRAGEPVPYRWNLSATLAAGLGIAELASPSHRIDTHFASPSTAQVTIASDQRSGDRDFVLRYRLAAGAIETGLLLYEGADENYFLMMMQPPRRPSRDSLPPREYVFILDVSGSMRGFPLQTGKRLMSNLLGGMRAADRFNVMFFAGGSWMLSPHSLPATAGNVRRALNAVDSQRGGGGTRLLPALQRALKLPANDQASRTFVVMTDGYVDVETATFDLIRANLDQANLFAFGIGTSVNRFLVEGMARAGMGSPFVVLDAGEAARQADRFRRYIETPVLTNIEVDFSGLDVYDVQPERIPDLFAERPIVVIGKYRGTARGSIAVRGTSGSEPFRRTLRVADFAPDADNAALRVLWARQRIAELGDYHAVAPSEPRARQITNLGLQYGLLTEFTSFVAIDSRVRTAGGETVTVRQPLPLPDGVSNSAVGGGYAATTSGSLAAPPRRERMAPVAESEAAADEVTAVGRPDGRGGFGDRVTRAPAPPPLQLQLRDVFSAAKEADQDSSAADASRQAAVLVADFVRDDLARRLRQRVQYGAPQIEIADGVAEFRFELSGSDATSEPGTLVVHVRREDAAIVRWFVVWASQFPHMVTGPRNEARLVRHARRAIGLAGANRNALQSAGVANWWYQVTGAPEIDVAGVSFTAPGGTAAVRVALHPATLALLGYWNDQSGEPGR